MKTELQLAKVDEAYHRKQMEYYQEKIKILRNPKEKIESIRKRKFITSMEKI